MFEVLIEEPEGRPEFLWTWLFDAPEVSGSRFFEQSKNVLSVLFRMFFMLREIFVDRLDDIWLSGLALREFSLM